MADNVNDEGESRTIQQIVRAVVANLNFIKGGALRLLRTNYSQFTFEENMSNFKTSLQNRDYPARIVEEHLTEIKFSAFFCIFSGSHFYRPRKRLGRLLGKS